MQFWQHSMQACSVSYEMILISWLMLVRWDRTDSWGGSGTTLARSCQLPLCMPQHCFTGDSVDRAAFVHSRTTPRSIRLDRRPQRYLVSTGKIRGEIRISTRSPELVVSAASMVGLSHIVSTFKRRDQPSQLDSAKVLEVNELSSHDWLGTGVPTITMPGKNRQRNFLQLIRSRKATALLVSRIHIPATAGCHGIWKAMRRCLFRRAV